MTGKTHMTSSLLCSSFLFRYNPINLIYAPFLILGAIILDVDNRYSIVQKITYIFFYSMLGIFIIYRNRNFITAIAVTLIIIMSIWSHKHTEHRTFTHSLLGLFLYSLCVFFISPIGAIYFSIGYVSHMVLDALSPKGVMLMYPYDKMFRIGNFKITDSDDTLINLLTFLLTIYFVLES